ncbi:hypothetical protein [Lutispora sp.]|uniref:hypothetical protein n=1 Tax=Lutispora sp. TaxID=2828727 RepID=UPI002B21B9AF|nr:hypothetical protein [Lutispora sp.]MEA4962921.1 hypothetical protein [Lutispora sp.]
MKTNIGLVEYAQKTLQEKWGYVWGTFGYMLTEALFKEKLVQYPDHVGPFKNFIRNNWLGRRVTDCVGLIKSYLWFSESSNKIVYDISTDIGANTVFDRAKEKGPIGTIPEIPGLCVWKKGHIGVYIGGGQVIEAKGTRYGVVQTPLKGVGANAWTHWLRYPGIQYIEAKPEPAAKDEVSPWAKEAAAWVIEKGISDGSRPKDTVTREEVWTMLYRMRG